MEAGLERFAQQVEPRFAELPRSVIHNDANDHNLLVHTDEGGVADGRMKAKSYGEDDPAVPNDSPANRKLNRRGVFKITLGD